VRHSARKAVYRAIRAGQLQRPDSCSRCEKPCKPDSHHTDYSAPLEVEWLCRRCHLTADREARRPRFGFKRLAARTVRASGRDGAELLHAWIVESGHTQREAAGLFLCDESMVSHMLAGRANPGLKLANRIAVLTGGAVVQTDWYDPANLLPHDGSAEKGAAA
jgi:hypothetical protein